MSLPRIDSSQAYRRFLQAYRQHNHNCPTTTIDRTRTRQDGTTYTQQVSKKEGTICESVKATFHNLLTEYVHSYNRLAENLVVGVYSQANPPSLLTNNVHLAWLSDCSQKTIYNHLMTLQKLGVVRKKYRGRKHDYELWISPEILFGGEGENFQKIVSDALLRGFSKELPPNNTHREIIEKEKRSADMLIGHGEDFHGERGRTDQQGEASPNAPEGPNPAGRREGVWGAGRAEIVAQKAAERQARASALLSKRNPSFPQALDPKFLNMLMEFWLYAWKVVYQERNFSRDQQEKALVAIAAGVYGNFQDDRAPREWAEFQVFQLGKLDKAARYYDAHPTAYRPDPYAVHIPGKGYFDAENVHGFTGIDAWMKKDAIQKLTEKLAYAKKTEDHKLRKRLLAQQADEQRQRCEALLRTARRDFEKLRAGIRLRAEVAEKTEMGLFQYYRVIFAAQGGDWLERFCKQYVDQKAVDFMPPKYLRSRRHRQRAGEMMQETVVYVESWMEDGEGYYS